MSKGFTNLGNTCYMNAALQCLSHIPQLNINCEDFIEDIQKRDSNHNSNLIKEWLNLQKNVWNSNEKVVSTLNILKEFIRCCRNENVIFYSFDQNDTTEFLNTFLDLLHTSIKRSVNVTVTGKPKNNYDKLKLQSIEIWKDFFENSYSHIIINFYSQLLSLTSCPECKYYTTNHEPILCITLTLKENYNTLYDCLNEFIEEEVLDTDNSWKCDKCNQYVQPHKKMNFWELSPILILSIKQFRLNKKINKHIDFPQVLNMDKYCININNDNLTYKLVGMCIHTGNLHGGHYYAICYDYRDKVWRVHNDTHVNEISIEEIEKETPYCFFYIRDE